MSEWGSSLQSQGLLLPPLQGQTPCRAGHAHPSPRGLAGDFPRAPSAFLPGLGRDSASCSGHPERNLALPGTDAGSMVEPLEQLPALSPSAGLEQGLQHGAHFGGPCCDRWTCHWHGANDASRDRAPGAGWACKGRGLERRLAMAAGSWGSAFPEHGFPRATAPSAATSAARHRASMPLLQHGHCTALSLGRCLPRAGLPRISHTPSPAC